MKMISWLKRVYLFPFMLMMGIPDGEVEGNPAEEAPTEGNEEEEGKSKEEPKEEPSEDEGDKVPRKALIAERKKRQEVEKQNEYLRGLAEGAGKRQEPVKNESIDAPLKKPNINDFETVEDYEDAHEEYILAKAEQRLSQKQQYNKQQETEQSRTQRFLEKIEEAAEEIPDLMDIYQDKTLPVSKAMAEVIQESDISPQLLLYLDKNRKEATRIARLSPILAAKEMGIIESKIINAPKAEVKKVSQAPEPIKPVTPSGSPVIDEDNLPINEWMQRRNAEQFGKRR